jgi:hypothetical protein
MTELRPDERMCPGTGHATTCVDDCLAEGPNCRRAAAENQRYAELEMMIDEISDAKPDPSFIERMADMLRVGVLSIQEAKEYVERMLPPRLFTFPGNDDKLQEALREAVQQHHALGRTARQTAEALGIPISRVRDLRQAGDHVIAMGYTPEAVIMAPAEGDIERGDLVEIGPDGRARRADDGHVVGVALGGNRIRMTPEAGRDLQEGRRIYEGFDTGGIEMSWANRGSHHIAAHHASIAFGRDWGFPSPLPPGPARDRPARFQYNDKFPKEVEDKALKLLEKFMSADQYDAFLKGSRIELENKAEDHRLLIDRAGNFSILKGPRGAGITMTSGRCRSYKYPLGDEIAAFLDWFNHRTLELIDRWRCGTFGIVDDGKMR